MMQCYLLFVHYLSQRLCFQIKKQRKKTKKKLIKRGLTYMYQYHVQVFFTFSGHAQRHFLSEFYYSLFFFKQVQIFHHNLFFFVIQFLKIQKYKSIYAIHYTFYQLSVLNLPSSLQNGET